MNTHVVPKSAVLWVWAAGKGKEEAVEKAANEMLKKDGIYQKQLSRSCKY